jgi:hypothetical protein
LGAGGLSDAGRGGRGGAARGARGCAGAAGRGRRRRGARALPRRAARHRAAPPPSLPLPLPMSLLYTPSVDNARHRAAPPQPPPSPISCSARPAQPPPPHVPLNPKAPARPRTGPARAAVALSSAHRDQPLRPSPAQRRAPTLCKLRFTCAQRSAAAPDAAAPRLSGAPRQRRSLRDAPRGTPPARPPITLPAVHHSPLPPARCPLLLLFSFPLQRCGFPPSTFRTPSTSRRPARSVGSPDMQYPSLWNVTYVC